MKRILLVLALALMLLLGVWGQAAAALGDDDETDDHPWGGTTSSGDQPQYRYEGSNTDFAYSTGILPVDMILNNPIYLDQLRQIFFDTAQADQESVVTSSAATRFKRLR